MSVSARIIIAIYVPSYILHTVYIYIHLIFIDSSTMFLLTFNL